MKRTILCLPLLATALPVAAFDFDARNVHPARITHDLDVPMIPTSSAVDTPPVAASEGETSNFREVWSVLKQKPLAPSEYGRQEVTWDDINELGGAARRTLSEHRDLVADRKNRLRPNGIALNGQWEITEESGFTGAFAKGAKSLVIARASTFSDAVNAGDIRSFGLSLKLYPTADANDAGRYKTANAFLIDNNAGSSARHFTDVELKTEAGFHPEPAMATNPSMIERVLMLRMVQELQQRADSNPEYRQLYPLSELGLSGDALKAAKTPARMMLKAAAGTPKVNAIDFRRELDMRYYPGGLVYEIFIKGDKEDKDWKKVGRIRFIDSVVSRAVDFNLNFPHPRYRK
ncbi:MAG: hypothetical protein HY078_13810 [Elusimicrobia bacterium]|nr:hypothetical protein [Elusimicrobiota bacterium]